MEQEPMEFWFEFASTYSYVAASRIEEVAAKAGVRIRWRPFLLGPIFASQGWGDSPFNLYPLKGQYMWRDMERLCEKYQIPFRRPSKFPRSGLLAARVACMAAEEPWCPRFVRAVLSRQLWRGPRDFAHRNHRGDSRHRRSAAARSAPARRGAGEQAAPARTESMGRGARHLRRADDDHWQGNVLG